eukprot:gene689-1318_t
MYSTVSSLDLDDADKAGYNTTGFYPKTLSTSSGGGRNIRQPSLMRSGGMSTMSEAEARAIHYGINLKQLKDWKAMQTAKNNESEEMQQEISVTNMRNFALAIDRVVQIQTWMRMRQQTRRYRVMLRERTLTRGLFFDHWAMLWRRFLVSNCFSAWAEECYEKKRMLSLALSLFRKALIRPHLSRQVTAAFFEPQSWHSELSYDEIAKIRYKVVHAFYRGWEKEIHRLKRLRYKGSQAIIRALRKGTTRVMWAQETRLVMFHMWRRLAATKPVPHFSTPALPEWTSLLQLLTSKHVRQKRSAHLASQLMIMRCWKWWRHLQGADISPDVFNNTLGIKVFLAWFDLSIERGSTFRRHHKCFRAWKAWAPRKRQLKGLREKVKQALLLQYKAHAYSIWSSTCHEIIGLRMYTLRGLRKNLCARHVLSCCYALSNRSAQFQFLHCWRRWQLWWSSRRRWKSALRQSRLTWHMLKAREILRAWAFVTNIARGMTRVSIKKTITNNTNEMAMVAAAATITTSDIPVTATDVAAAADGGDVASNMSHDTDSISRLISPSLSMSMSLGSNEMRLNDTSIDPDPFIATPVLNNNNNNNNNGIVDNIGIGIGNNIAMMNGDRNGNSGIGNRNNGTGNGTGRPSLPSTPLVGRVIRELYELYTHGVANGIGDYGSLQARPDEVCFMLCCRAVAILDKDAAADNNALIMEDEKEKSSDGNGTGTSIGIGAGAAGLTMVQQQRNTQLREQCKRRQASREQLQRALDAMDISAVIEAIKRGSQVRSHHVAQMAAHFGDKYVCLLAVLLGFAPAYCAERVLRCDINQQIMVTPSPLAAVLLTSHIARWSRRELTLREVAALARDDALSNATGSKFQTNVMWRAITLRLIQQR